MLVVLIKSYAQKPWRNPETYQLIEAGLRDKWEVVSIVPTDPHSLEKYIINLEAEHPEGLFVFNIAEYIDETHKIGFLPELLEAWGVPHLGSSAAAIACALDKGRAKQLFDLHNIPTPPYFIVRPEDGDFRKKAEEVGYPMIVKPLLEGGHLGIHEDSIVEDAEGLERIVTRVLQENHEPALVEKFLTGTEMREFSVGVIAGDPMRFCPIEIDFEAMDVGRLILSYEAAQKDEERIMPVAGAETRAEIINLAYRAFQAVGASDYSRVDLRMDASGCYVLEINTMPGLGPHSFLPEAAADIYGLDYSQLVQMLAEESMRRQMT